MSYAERTRRPPRTPTEDEVAKLLKVSGKHADTFRDHMIFSIAVGTGLREKEIVSLDVGDVMRDDGKPRRSFQLRYYARKGKRKKGPAKQVAKAERDEAAAQVVHLPDATYYKLEKYLKWKDDAGFKARDRLPDAPLFWSRLGNRLSTRRVRALFREWQVRAGFDTIFPFHALRHYAISDTYRQTHDIRIAQRVARHARIDTTTRYEHASDDEVAKAVRKRAA